ncbi:hypothetical protein SAMN06265784_103197 [Paraburkholderia susongensis]|uniref:Uncharacterized protein n=1 Tax=Paraburkholderia susongensis TaxID=1515439 RepID=A0A1X7JYX5_9BURK|nr:hypothetical protein SAMN06265784_103197 [Paraburkholderia susongensis]
MPHASSQAPQPPQSSSPRLHGAAVVRPAETNPHAGTTADAFRTV